MSARVLDGRPEEVMAISVWLLEGVEVSDDVIGRLDLAVRPTDRMSINRFNQLGTRSISHIDTSSRKYSDSGLFYGFVAVVRWVEQLAMNFPYGIASHGGG